MMYVASLGCASHTAGGGARQFLGERVPEVARGGRKAQERGEQVRDRPSDGARNVPRKPNAQGEIERSRSENACDRGGERRS